MRQKLVAANWKMNPTREAARALLVQLREMLPEALAARCLVIPPALHMALAEALLGGSGIRWGAQNICTADAGAFTGEHSAVMFREYGCSHVLVGHSERRCLFGEDEKIVSAKFHHAKERDMIPVLCVGETLEQREQGLTEAVLARQIRAVGATGADTFSACVVAYEPVWAIGTGLTATPEAAQAAHQYIRSLVAEYNTDAAKNLPILYGGSVNAQNCASLFAMPDVDGGLVGGASLDAHQFVEIVKCIN